MPHRKLSRSRGILIAALASSVGTVFAQGATPSADRASAVQPAVRSTGPTPHRLVVAPAAALDDTKFAGGCWVRFHDGKNFKGEELTLMGPLQLPDMALASPWWRRWNSVSVGPKARVTIRGGSPSEDRSMMLEPGQRTADLASRQGGWFGKIRSADVSCVRG